MKRLGIFIFVIIFIHANVRGSVDAEGITDVEDIILVVSKQSLLTSLSTLETRKLFLGIPVEKNGVVATPLINFSDTHTHENFLKEMVFMSENSYNRELLKRTVKFGTVLPKKYDYIADLVEQLDQDPSAVSFIYNTDLESYPELKILNIE